MKELSIEKRIRILRNIGFHPEKIQRELDANVLIAKIEALEKDLGEKVETPIRQRIKRWRNVGWHPERIMYELEAQAKILEAKVFEKKSRKRKREDEEPDSPKFPLTTAQAARKLGIHKDTLRRWLDDLGIDPPRTRGGHARINREIFKELREEFEKPARYH